jgi:hypothetical protein
MDSARVLTALVIGALLSSCVFLRDFDELQGGAAEVGAGGSAAEGAQSPAESAATAGSSGAPGGGIPIEQAPAAVADVLCETMLACLGSAALELVFYDEDCKAIVERLLANTVVAQVEQSEADDTLHYDATALPACIEAIGSLPCDEVSVAFPEACKQALGGPQTEGGPCAHGLECEVGLYCDASACLCRAFLQQGAACGATDTCAPGLTCFQESCMPLGTVGDDCGGGVLPGCLTGLLCLGANESAGETGTCFETADLFVLSEGQNCNVFANPPSLCVEGLSCVAGLLGGTCVEQAPSGGACQAAVPDMCPAGERCADGTCTPLPAPGEPCVLLSYPQCQAYSRCVNGTCRRLGDNGNTCVQPAECYSQVCEAGLCVAPRCN